MDRKLCGIDPGIPPSCDAAAAADAVVELGGINSRIPPSCVAAAAAATDAVVELGGIPGLLAAALTVLTTF